MKIAALGAGHWHVALMYILALTDLGQELVALADTSSGHSRSSPLRHDLAARVHS
jgi:hypothetical protein